MLTNAVRYVDPDGAVTADILDSARALHSLKNLDSCQPNGQGWLKTPQQTRQLAKEIGQATEKAGRTSSCAKPKHSPNGPQ